MDAKRTISGAWDQGNGSKVYAKVEDSIPVVLAYNSVCSEMRADPEHPQPLGRIGGVTVFGSFTR
jgi:hypothetical protein